MILVSMNIENIASVMANVVYLIDRLHMNVDKAFTYTCRKYKCHSDQFTREDLFNLVHEFISKFIFVKSLAEKLGKKSLSYRMYAKLFLYTKLRELGYAVPSKLSKAIYRDFGRIDFTSIDLEPWQNLSYPQWLYYRLIEVIDKDEVEKILNAMNRRIIWLRINTLKIDIDKALNLLEQEGVRYEVEKHVQFIVKILRSPKPPRSLRIVKEGAAVIQDKASVLTVLAMDPKPGDLIYDFAAAPGIKTSLIMQIVENNAKIIAFDRSPRRLMSMKSLLKKYGVDVARVDLALTDSRIVYMTRRADIALVDAPCSSSGAIPKDPSIKLLLKGPEIPRKMHQIQISLLKNALKYCERVVFATCSILPDEGEEVVEKVLSVCNCDLEDTKIPASRGYRKYSIWSRVRRTYPHLDDCEGFFIARIASYA